MLSAGVGCHFTESNKQKTSSKHIYMYFGWLTGEEPLPEESSAQLVSRGRQHPRLDLYLALALALAQPPIIRGWI